MINNQNRRSSLFEIVGIIFKEKWIIHTYNDSEIIITLAQSIKMQNCKWIYVQKRQCNALVSFFGVITMRGMFFDKVLELILVWCLFHCATWSPVIRVITCTSSAIRYACSSEPIFWNCVFITATRIVLLETSTSTKHHGPTCCTTHHEPFLLGYFIFVNCIKSLSKFLFGL